MLVYQAGGLDTFVCCMSIIISISSKFSKFSNSSNSSNNSSNSNNSSSSSSSVININMCWRTVYDIT